MKFGVCIFPTEWTVQPAELARLAEERGFESLWFTEHTHIPTSRRTPWPGGPILPDEYAHTYDPFVALTMAATATRDLRLGTGICLVVEREPKATARQVATLDRVSNGRFLFGIGGGWNAEEMENHGTDFSTRFRLLDERVRRTRELWAEADFEPAPLQRPHPPILMGGDGTRTLDRAVEYADGWMPICRGGILPPGLRERIVLLRQKASAAGRDPASLPVTIYFAPPHEEAIAEMQSYGVDRAVFLLPAVEPEKLLPVLDQYARLAQSAASVS
jgi:probable F420-dependent oxidoreductase